MLYVGPTCVDPKRKKPVDDKDRVVSCCGRRELTTMTPMTKADVPRCSAASSLLLLLLSSSHGVHVVALSSTLCHPLLMMMTTLLIPVGIHRCHHSYRNNDNKLQVLRRCALKGGPTINLGDGIVACQSSSGRGKALWAATIFFVPRQSSLCRGKALRAAAKLFFPRQENDVPWRCAIVLHVAARNDLPQHCTAFRAVVSLCLGKKRPAAAFRGMSRRAAPLFVMPQPSLLCRGVVSLCHGKKRRAAAFHAVVLWSAAKNNTLLHPMKLLRHGASCCCFARCVMAARMKKTINLCSVGRHSGVVAFVLALLFFCFLRRLLLCCFLKGGKAINLFGLGGVAVVVVVVGCCVCVISGGCIVVSCGCVMVVAVVVSWLWLVVVFASFPAVASLFPADASWLLRLLCLGCGWLLCLRRFQQLRCHFRWLRRGCCGRHVLCLAVVFGCHFPWLHHHFPQLHRGCCGGCILWLWLVVAVA